MNLLYSDDSLDNFTNDILGKLFRPSYFDKQYYIIHFFPQDTVSYMLDDIKYDINEMGECIRNSLYTSGMLMGFRIFEKTIKTHLEDDLKIKSNQFYKSIQYLNKSFSKDFVKRLQKIRKIRNKAVHSDKIFNENETYDLLDDIIWIVLYVYSIITDES